MQAQQHHTNNRPIAYQQSWISAYLSDNLLFVYRSVKLRDTDPLYEPVAKLLAGWHGKLLERHVEDENMMFGQAVMAWYELGEPSDGGTSAPFGVSTEAV